MMPDETIPTTSEPSPAKDSEASTAPATEPIMLAAPETGESEGNAAVDATLATDVTSESAASESERPRTASAPAGKAGGHGSPMALQDMFLNGLRRENIDAVVYFCDGSQERGAVRAFDTFTILLENRSSGKLQLIYKHAVARIFPTRCPQLSLLGRGRSKG